MQLDCFLEVMIGFAVELTVAKTKLVDNIGQIRRVSE